MGEANAEVGGRREARWPTRLAIAMFCFAGAGAGFFSERPAYRAVGLLHYERVRGLMTDEQPRAYTAEELAAEGRMIRSRRIAELAMQGPDWSTSWPKTPMEAEDLIARLMTRVEAGSLVEVSYQHPDPVVAEKRLKAVMLAYYSFSTNRARSDDDKRLRVLDDRRALLIGQITRLESQIFESGVLFGTTELGLMHDKEVEEVLRLEWAVQVDPPRGATRPTTGLLFERLKEERTHLAEISRRRLRVEELKRQRDEAERDKEIVQRRMDQITMDGALPGPISIMSASSVLPTPIDPRPRRAAWGAAGGFVAFFALRLLLRRWRFRRRIVNARTAFPVITHHEPRAVIAIEEAAPAAPAPLTGSSG